MTTLERLFHSCSYCYSFWPCEHILCDSCLMHIAHYSCGHLAEVQVEAKTFEMIALYHWVPGECTVLSSLPYLLKGKSRGCWWRIFAERTVWALTTEIKIHRYKKIWLCVPPISIKRQENHSFGFARAILSGIVELTDYPEQSIQIFELPSVSNQPQAESKHLNARDRLSRLRAASLQKTDLSLVFDKSDLLLFVDDILTSGATAARAFLQCQEPTNFYIIVLCHRRLT